MDLFKEFFHSVFSNPRASGRGADRRGQTQNDAELEDRFSFQDGRGERFEGFPSFSRQEDIWREMDNTFDELFKMFGVDNIPMFDHYVPPPFPGVTHRPSPADKHLPANANVRDAMLKGRDNSSLYQPEQEVNVRSYMLKKNPTPSSNKRSTSDEGDVSWDGLLKKGATVDDILDTNKQSAPQAADKPHSFFRYSKITTTRRADGTVETRRITRDESGNEKETVEISGGS